MERNGMCPICYLVRNFVKKRHISKNFYNKPYDNGCALTPPMGWSSWNCFKNHIDEEQLLAIGTAMKEKGLIAAGYKFLNLDDCWQSSLRDENGDMQGDLTKFPSGIPNLVSKLNAMGIKVGIYSSNGTYTCEDLPASLGNEWRDALTFARWGVEFFKYDFCHNVPISNYAPLIESISIAPSGGKDILTLPCTDALLYGFAKLMRDNNMPCGKYISGMDAGLGKCEFKNVVVPEDGEYTLTVQIKKHGRYTKHLMAQIQDEFYEYEIPTQKFWNHTARFQRKVMLKAGGNTITFFNPIEKSADSAMVQYHRMGECLKKATKLVAKESGNAEKPIVYSICEWGSNRPHHWGATAGNLWRTTGDISAYWLRIMQVYSHNVKLHEYAGVGGWNDPDMLEVGNGKLTLEQNKSHFALWCMMAAPLILGNDLRSVSDDVINIVTNANLIAIDQDSLGKQGKRVVSGRVDVIAKPLADGACAISVFNTTSKPLVYTLDIAALCDDSYLNIVSKNSYNAIEMWSGAESTISSNHAVKLAPYETMVIKIK